MAVISLRKMIGRLSIKGDQYSLTIKLFFFSNPVFKKQSKYWVAESAMQTPESQTPSVSQEKDAFRFGAKNGKDVQHCRLSSSQVRNIV